MADLIRWKFYEDLRHTKVSFTTVIITPPDYNRYGGLLDLFNGRLAIGKMFDIEVENYCHSGLVRLSAAPCLGQTQAGRVDQYSLGTHDIDRQGTFITELLNDRPLFATPPRALSGTFAEYAELASRIPHHVRRLSHVDCFLPGYSPRAGQRLKLRSWPDTGMFRRDGWTSRIRQ